MSALNNSLLLGQEGGGGYAISRSLRFNSSDSAYLSRTPASAGNRKTWTFATWAKLTGPYDATDDYLLYAYGSGTSQLDYFDLRWQSSSGVLRVGGYNSAWRTTTAVFRDPSAWYHIVLVWDTTQATAANRVKLYVNGVEQTAFSSSSNPSLDDQTSVNNTVAHRLGNTSNLLLADCFLVDGQALDPTSFGEFSATTGVWMPKAYSGSYGTNGFHLDFSDNSTSAALGTDTSGNGNTWTVNNFQATVQTGRLYAQASGTSTSAFSSATLLGNFPATVGGSYAIYDADLVTPVTSATFSYLYSFGSVVEVLVSADGTNWTSKGNQSSSYTTVSHTSAFRYVRWFYSTFNFGITNNPAQNDSLVDVPTNGSEVDTGAGGQVRGNYATLNPLARVSFGSGTGPMANGNLELVGAAGIQYVAVSTIALNTSVYAEFVGATQYIGLKAVNSDNPYIWFGTVFERNGSAEAVGVSYNSTDVVGIAFNPSTLALTFYKNGAFQYTKTIASGEYVFLVSTVNAGNCVCNFGQRPFAYPAPSGFKALCTANLPAPVVTKPSTVMDVSLWTGNNSTQTITGLGFSPGLVWMKSRSNAINNGLFDQVRGTAKFLESNTTTAEQTKSGITAFNSDGFTLGSHVIGNTSPYTYVGWCWDAGSSTVTNTQGSISSQVRANASAGFSVLTYSGANGGTVGHGLGVAPSLVIVKCRSNADGWVTYHKDLGPTNTLQLQSTNAVQTSDTTAFNSTAPSSTLVTLGNSGRTCESGRTYVAYCFAPVAGYSSFGSYTGNGSADGPFVYTGFRPRWILWKCTTAAYDWDVYDAVRDPYNAAAARLKPNSSDAEATLSPATFDILSNGFKLRQGYNSSNASGQIYIYFAVAESPFQYARAR